VAMKMRIVVLVCLGLSLSFCAFQFTRPNKECFVSASPEMMLLYHRAYDAAEGLDTAFNRTKNRVQPYGPNWPKVWKEKENQYIQFGDSILQVDGCSLNDIARSHPGSFDVSPYSRDGLVSKIDLVLLGTGTEIRLNINEIIVLRDGRKTVLKPAREEP